MLVRPEPCPGRVDRVDPGPRHRRRKRAGPGLRHAFRQPRKGHPVALRSRGGRGAGRWPDGAAAAPDGTRPRAGSASGADDIPGDLAELYGYVNRSFPDSDLDAFVESLANRIASFDKQAISETKRFADVASLPPDFEIAPEWDVCLASIMRPAAQERIRMLLERGFHRPGDVEDRLGYHVGQLGR